MVKLEEVPDEDLHRAQEGPLDDDKDWESDDGSEISEVDDDDDLDESLYERIAALKDVIPPQQRRQVASTVSTASAWVRSGLLFSGKALWIVSTSALLLGVPWALAFAEEQQQQEYEREMKMQQSANEVLAPGATGEAKPAI